MGNDRMGGWQVGRWEGGKVGRADVTPVDPESNDWDPTGKTPDEIAVWYADYEHGQRSEMAKRLRRAVEHKFLVFYLRAQCND